MKALVSNGSNQFHLAPLAAQLHQQGRLAGLVTAGWPTPFAAAVARPFISRSPKVQRFFNRREDLPREVLFPSNSSEILFQFGILLRRISERTEQRFDRLAFNWYAANAGRVLRKLRPDIYHYRSCYGLGSVVEAKKLRIPAVCDHSIAHPGVLQYMVDHEGRWPEQTEKRHASPLHRLMRIDIHQADALIVNSDFVKDSCIFSGIPEEKVHVVYTGLTRKYMGYVPPFDFPQVKARAGRPMLFSGYVQRRKGVPTLAEAFLRIPQPPQFKIIGTREPGIDGVPAVKQFFAHNQVESIATVSWPELARRMTEAPVFVFPSYCEGSARVIFEAMACGCFIITTPNSGSIVRDQVHGLVVPPGDANALAAAIRWASESPEIVARTGWANAQLARSEFRQEQYGGKIVRIYEKILNQFPRELDS
jgi:glycosyltransferase involved in cell wall biosynthesis